MEIKTIKKISNNQELRKRLAKLLVRDCFRNTYLEDLHATPLNRISDKEMKDLMIDAVNHTYLFIDTLFTSKTGDKVVDYLEKCDIISDWNEPEYPKY